MSTRVISLVALLLVGCTSERVPMAVINYGIADCAVNGGMTAIVVEGGRYTVECGNHAIFNYALMEGRQGESVEKINQYGTGVN